MKAVPKVNTDGLYIEDELMDDAFTGVVPFYSAATAPGPDFTFETDDEEEQPEEHKPVIAGYIVSVPVPSGLYLPRFDLEGWEAYQVAIATANEEYQNAYSEWVALPEDERGDSPVYIVPEQPELWGEGLTPEQIEALHPPREETDPEKIARLEQENKLLAAQNAANADRMEFIEDVIAEMALKVYE